MTIRDDLSASGAASRVDSGASAEALETAANWPSVNPSACFLESESAFSEPFESGAFVTHLSQCGIYRMERSTMERLTFVVKGNAIAAQKAVDAHGIKAHVISYMRVETVFQAESTEELAKVAAWFGEHSELEQGYGYPDGTCLIYSQHEGRE